MATHKTVTIFSSNQSYNGGKKKKAVNQETIKNPVKYLHKDWYLFLASTETNYVLSIFYIHLINLS